MRRLLLVTLTAVSMLMCCSCSSLVSLKKPSESGVSQDTVSERSIEDVYLEQKESAIKDREKRDKSEMQTFTDESDGVIPTVMTDKREYTAGEPVKIKSTAQNITDGEVCNQYSYLGETHYSNGEPVGPGGYNGTCYIYTVPNKHDHNKTIKHSVDFSITLK